MLNPGSSNFIDPKLTVKLNVEFKAFGEVKTDPTMEQLIKLVERIYKDKKQIQGKLHIYNLFDIQCASASKAIAKFEELVNAEKYRIDETLVSKEELQSHPWILLGWSVEYRAHWKNLKAIKLKWRKLIDSSRIPVFGKKHKKRDDYYHPCPLISTKRPEMLDDLISLYEEISRSRKST